MEVQAISLQQKGAKTESMITVSTLTGTGLCKGFYYQTDEFVGAKLLLTIENSVISPFPSLIRLSLGVGRVFPLCWVGVYNVVKHSNDVEI